MIELYTARTPNGFKVSVALEEMGLEYTVRSIDLGQLEQKEGWFLGISPNGLSRRSSIGRTTISRYSSRVRS